MAFLASQLKAIHHLATKNGWKVQLSANPTVYFLDQNGDEISRNIMNIVSEYQADMKAEKAAARRRASNPGIVRRTPPSTGSSSLFQN